MRRYELPPHLLELELTESAFLENESGLFESMKPCRPSGSSSPWTISDQATRP